jgi:hypothetical protein
LSTMKSVRIWIGIEYSSIITANMLVRYIAVAYCYY